MAIIQFVEKRFNAATKVVIQQANDIVAEYAEAGFKLTLRQLYYQFVSRSLIANTPAEYKRLGSIINDARLAGQLDWDVIEDRGRNLQHVSTWESPVALIETCVKCFAMDLWAGQEYRPEVWVEKEALSGVVEPVCRDQRIAYIACKGYMSQSEMFEAGFRRFRGYIQGGQTPVILHLGDHDPSGLDMTRDITDRLRMFTLQHVEVRRLALNMDQIKTYNPPPNPAKVTDARFEGYQKQFGDESWELDALDPKVIAQLINLAVDELRSGPDWNKALKAEKVARGQLQQIHERYDDVCAMLAQKPKK